MEWVILDSGCKPGSYLMQKDQELLDALKPNDRPILHFYRWEGINATYGYFIKPADFFHECDIQLTRRPTGGGIIFHVSDFAFSLLIPANHPGYSLNVLDNYAYVNNRILSGLIDSFGGLFETLKSNNCDYDPCVPFCMAKPTQYDLMLHGKKIGGAAQRRTKNGFLHQGSLFVGPAPIDLMKSVLKESDLIIEAMQKNSHSLIEKEMSTEALEALRSTLQKMLIQQFTLQCTHSRSKDK